jgi:Cys-rich protein (TIGR01571 family)
MEKVSLVSGMGDSAGRAEPQPSARSGHVNRVLEVHSGLRAGSARHAGEAAEFEDGAEDLLTRRRSGTPPFAGVASSPSRLLKPVSMIFAPPNRFRASAPADGPRSGMSVTLPCVGEVRWQAVQEMAAEWLRNPKNWAVAVWGAAVFVSGAMLFMVMVGMLNAVLPRKADRDLWFEASNQSINALFTLFVLLLHPVRVLHLVWLLRWRRKDIPKLRAVYCKGGRPKPNEWSHMLAVLLLYQLNCFAQYAVCALNWCYNRAQRPVAAVMVCFVIALSAGCAAGIYTNLSPLGKDSPPGEDDAENLASGIAAKPLPARFLHAPPNYDRLLDQHPTLGASRAGTAVENPQWQGGLFDCWEAPALVAATACCFPCVLGHNLSRLGFGNRYVHVATFLLACCAPFVIFEMAAVNVDSRSVISSLPFHSPHLFCAR